MYTHPPMYTDTSVYTHTPVYTHILVYTHQGTHTHKKVHTHKHTHQCIHTHIQTQSMYTHTHTHPQSMYTHTHTHTPCPILCKVSHRVSWSFGHHFFSCIPSPPGPGHPPLRAHLPLSPPVLCRSHPGSPADAQTQQPSPPLPWARHM